MSAITPNLRSGIYTLAFGNALFDLTSNILPDKELPCAVTCCAPPINKIISVVYENSFITNKLKVIQQHG